jgi:SPP1 gp7 family putative phage head morphogenesis protein
MMVTEPDVNFAIGLPPEQAIAHLQAKGLGVTGSWRDWVDGQHARAFTVANVTKLDVLDDIHKSLVDALKNGKTFEQWKTDLVPTLQQKGWWQREATAEQLKSAGRLNTDTGEIAKGLAPFRLKTIYATNMQSAYQAGRYDQMMEQAAERPFWGYEAVLDRLTRPRHRAMHGMIFRYDDKGWASFYPSCGYRCRCRARNYSQRDIDRKGLKVSSTDGYLSQVDVPLKGGGTVSVTRFSHPGMPGGYFQPDPGFSNNPAKSVWMPNLADKPAELSRAFVRQAVDGPQFARFVQAKGDLQGVFPVGVARPALTQGALDPTVYLHSEQLAQGVGKALTPAQWRLLPDLVEFGAEGGHAGQAAARAAADAAPLDISLEEADGVLKGQIVVDELGSLRLQGLTWLQGKP